MSNTQDSKTSRVDLGGLQSSGTRALEGIVSNGFSLLPRWEGTTLLVRLLGNADMDAIAPFNAALKHMHSEAVRLFAREVRLDLSELYFMNSSCFKAIVSWLVPVSRMSPPAYSISFVTNQQLHWQKRSLEALRQLAPSVVSILAPAAGTGQSVAPPRMVPSSTPRRST
jgi:hypothetical protein